MSGLLSPDVEESITGSAEILEIFKVSKVGKVAGSKVTTGEISQDSLARVIRDEDYVAAASSHKGLQSGNLNFLTFGRNEPALHHYHNTYREALGLQKLPIIES